MTKLTNQQIRDYEKLCEDRDKGRILTPDGLRLICRSCDFDPEAIGRYFLELLPKICPEDYMI